jgi:peptidoglycan-associated lipoprotein
VAITVAEVRVTVTDYSAATPLTKSLVGDALYFDANIRDIFFDLDSYTIRADARQTLQENARILRDRPNIQITIEGHADERGSARYNLVLGDRRANSVRDYMVGLGIPANRIHTISYGKERPFCFESNEACWQLNRRGRFVMR